MRVMERLGSFQFDPLDIAGPEPRPAPGVADRRLPAGLDGRVALRRACAVRGLQQGAVDPADGRTAVVSRELGSEPRPARRQHVRRPRRPRRGAPRSDPARRPAVLHRHRAARVHRLVLATDEPGPGRAGGAGRGRHPGHLAARGQPPHLRPGGAAVPGGAAGRDPAGQSEQFRHKLLARYRANGLLGTVRLGRAVDRAPTRRVAGRDQAMRASRRGPRSWPELLEVGELVPVTVEGVKGERYIIREDLACWRRPRRVTGADDRRAVAWPSWRRSIRSCGTGTCSGRCTTSTTSGRSTSRPRSGGGATTSCRCCSATTSSVASSRGRTARNGVLRITDVWWEAGFDPLAAPGFVEAFVDALTAHARVRRGRTDRLAALRPASRASGGEVRARLGPEGRLRA